MAQQVRERGCSVARFLIQERRAYASIVGSRRCTILCSCTGGVCPGNGAANRCTRARWRRAACATTALAAALRMPVHSLWRAVSSTAPRCRCTPGECYRHCGHSAHGDFCGCAHTSCGCRPAAVGSAVLPPPTKSLTALRRVRQLSCLRSVSGVPARASVAPRARGVAGVRYGLLLCSAPRLPARQGAPACANAFVLHRLHGDPCGT